ncbi:MAG: ECF transporter S component [Lachnospiraceae bacterium]|nr:ECF transporter S component [Lachnospiraceae bacterium]
MKLEQSAEVFRYLPGIDYQTPERMFWGFFFWKIPLAISRRYCWQYPPGAEIKEREEAMREVSGTRKKQQGKLMVMVASAMLGGLAAVLMLFQVPLPFAPSFYKLDLSEVPVLVGGFMFGPPAAVLIEAVKILLHVLLKGSVTAGVGELANFLIGLALVLPASLIYRTGRTKTGALIGCVSGTVLMTVTAALLNAFVLLPLYAKAFGGMEAILALGTAVNGAINSVQTFVLIAVVPFNLVKGSLVSLILILLYTVLKPVMNRYQKI